jgi:predicted membrane protein
MNPHTILALKFFVTSCFVTSATFFLVRSLDDDFIDRHIVIGGGLAMLLIAAACALTISFIACVWSL